MLDALTLEQKAALLFAGFMAFIGLLVTFGRMLDARAKREVMQMERDKDDTTTKNNTIKLITDRFAKSDDLNSELHIALRECEVDKKEKEGVIKDLRKTVHELGERNEMQGKLLMQSAGEIKALRDLNDLQEARIREFEFKEAQRLKDGYEMPKSDLPP